MKIVRYFLIIVTVVILTVLTQAGGLIYLLSFSTHGIVNRKVTTTWPRRLLKLGSFLVLYSLFTYFIIPLLAKPFGRVPLPVVSSNYIRPVNFFTCFFNRHYVTPAMKRTVMEVAAQMNKEFPGTTITYLDANFPFINGFPLVPHLSHNDGRKLDLAFFYVDKRSGQPVTGSPSFIGYGICEEPRPHEMKVPCEEQGHWQYSFIRNWTPQRAKEDFLFDNVRTKRLVELTAGKPVIQKIFIEPHLKVRLGLNSNKIRFHGCQAVRHDDHLHIQSN